MFLLSDPSLRDNKTNCKHLELRTAGNNQFCRRKERKFHVSNLDCMKLSVICVHTFNLMFVIRKTWVLNMLEHERESTNKC